MSGPAQPDAPLPAQDNGEGMAAADPAASTDNSKDHSNGGQALGEQELEAALQLLVERAQYITGATGAALALPVGEEMVCRASAGAAAPPVGARLQVQSGLTGESIVRRQLLRCDNAENDPRVNRETCQKMGIASIVVLPLLRRSGEIRGLFELFSDHAHAFEEWDLRALERMADLTLTALDLAEGQPGAVAGFVRARQAARGVTPAGPGAETAEAPAARAGGAAPGVEQIIDRSPGPNSKVEANQASAGEEVEAGTVASGESTPSEAVAAGVLEEPSPAVPPAAVPEAMRRVQKCAACGFPVSEGRTYCLDCERKASKLFAPSEPVAVESVPSFLDVSAPPDESWLADHVNLLAIVVLILGILVAVVIFR